MSRNYSALPVRSRRNLAVTSRKLCQKVALALEKWYKRGTVHSPESPVSESKHVLQGASLCSNCSSFPSWWCCLQSRALTLPPLTHKFNATSRLKTTVIQNRNGYTAKE